MKFVKSLLAGAVLAASTTATALPISGHFSFATFGSSSDTGPNGTPDGTVDTYTVTSVATFGGFTGGALENIFGPHATTLTFNTPTFGANTATPFTWWTLGIDNGSDLVGNLVYSADTAGLSDGSGTLDLFLQGTLSFVPAGAGCLSSFCSDFEPTVSNWNFSNPGGLASATSVAEPASLALIGLGIAGLGVARRKLK